MAFLLIWQLSVALVKKAAEDTAFAKTMSSIGPGHSWIGVTILGLLILRVIWRSINRGHAPRHTGTFAALGQFAMYLLMAVVPLIALLRAYGSGRGFPRGDAWLVPATGTEVPWMVQLGQMFHGELAWVLFVLIAGHVFMAIWHHKVRHDDTLGRMIGRG